MHTRMAEFTLRAGPDRRTGRYSQVSDQGDGWWFGVSLARPPSPRAEAGLRAGARDHRRAAGDDPRRAGGDSRDAPGVGSRATDTALGKSVSNAPEPLK